MKIRLTSDGIRLRIRKSGLEQLLREGSITEVLHFAPGQNLAFELRLASVENIHASLKENRLSISVPTEMAKRWADTGQVSLEHQQIVDGEHGLHLLIEKDFPCKHQPQEDKADTFQELADKAPERPSV